MSLGPRALALLAYLQPSPERLEQEKRLLPQGPCLPEAQGPGHSLGLTHTGPHLSDSNTELWGAAGEERCRRKLRAVRDHIWPRVLQAPTQQTQQAAREKRSWVKEWVRADHKPANLFLGALDLFRG